MKQLNLLQKIALMRILLDIINADGRIDSRETFYYNKIANILGMTDDDKKYANQANSLLSLLQLKEFSNEQKKFVAEVMGQMIVVDEDINVNEMAIFELVCDTCNIHISFNDVVTLDQISQSTRS